MRITVPTPDSCGKAMFQILGVFAEFEPSIIQERVRADLARATETAVRATLANGTGMMKAAKMHGIDRL